MRAPCCNAWWLRLDMTCDELITMSYKWQEPKHPVKLLEKINDPLDLLEVLRLEEHELLVGSGHRDIVEHGDSLRVELLLDVVNDLSDVD